MALLIIYSAREPDVNFIKILTATFFVQKCFAKLFFTYFLTKGNLHKNCSINDGEIDNRCDPQTRHFPDLARVSAPLNIWSMSPTIYV